MVDLSHSPSASTPLTVRVPPISATRAPVTPASHPHSLPSVASSAHSGPVPLFTESTPPPPSPSGPSSSSRLFGPSTGVLSHREIPEVRRELIELSGTLLERRRVADGLQKEINQLSERVSHEVELIQSGMERIHALQIEMDDMSVGF